MTASRRVSALLAATVAALGMAAARPAGARGRPAPPAKRLDRAVTAATQFLLGRIGPDGQCKGEFPEKDPRFGGKTALCAHALLTAGLKPADSPPLRRALMWLAPAKLHGTYAVAMRACALSALREPEAAKLLARDVAWLMKAMDDRGRYTYTSCAGAASETYDNSNAQMALLGVWAGARRGVEVPKAYWQRVEKHWLDQQHPDGGWGYRIDPRRPRAKSYGSMTAAGLASLYICFDNLRADQFVRCAAVREYQPIARSLAWLAANFAADENPAKGVEWYYYWLYCLARVGLASGHKYFGGHDWYAEGLEQLLARQNPEGSWGYGDCIAETSFALVFIVRGRHPVLLNKLRYGGKWNARPRDAANLARWISFTFERPVSWQVVNVDSPMADWHEAPILYVSGAGAVEFSGAQLDKLRTFVAQGGVILSEAACNNGDFTLDMRKTYQRLFPTYPLSRLPPEHALYTAQFDRRGGAWLSGVSNGVRLLAVHAPRELSLAMQLGPKKAHLPIFELAANVYMYATDKGTLRPRGARYWPQPAKVAPRATIRLARVKHAGNWDPEPLAWRRFAVLLANRHAVRLEVAPTTIADLDASKWPVAYLTGTGALALTDAERKALRGYLAAGGTLIVEAAGGDKAFAESARKLIEPLVAGGRAGLLIQDHPLYRAGPYDLQKVRYRRDYALSLGEDRTRPRLRAVQMGKRLAVILSREDLTTGLLGIPAYKLRGYDPDSAEKLMTNILFHAAGVRPGAAKPAPRERPPS